MKTAVLKILKLILKKLASGVVKKYGPSVIAVTGSVGKTSAKEAVFAVLKNNRRARMTAVNFNNELGVPLAVLGGWQKVGKPVWWFWLKVIVSGLLLVVLPRRSRYPEALVLEYAADRPGDLKYLIEIARPKIGVVTAVGEVPVHVEFYGGPEAVAREKSRVAEALPSTGFAVLNRDDEAVFAMKEKTRAQTVTFGFEEGADVRITSFENRSVNGRPEGISFKLEHAGSLVPVKINGVFGRAHAYAAAAGAGVGLIFGFNLVKISESLAAGYQPPKGRMRLIKGIKDTFIIDDSYNASPLSMRAALDALRDVKAKRRIAVLGDMLEIGEYSVEAHQAIGDLAARSADVIVTVGPRAKFVAEAALAKGISSKNVLTFDAAEEACLPVQNIIKKGDVILVKASRAIGLDRIVEEIRADAPIV